MWVSLVRPIWIHVRTISAFLLVAAWYFLGMISAIDPSIYFQLVFEGSFSDQVRRFHLRSSTLFPFFK